MPRKKQIVKSVKKTQKQKQKVSVVVNVNSNNKKKNVVSRQPKMTPQSSAPQVIYIQAPASSNVNDRFSVPSASPHINEKVHDKTPPPPAAAADPITTDPRLRAELLIEEATTEPIAPVASIEVDEPLPLKLKTKEDHTSFLKKKNIFNLSTLNLSQLQNVYKVYRDTGEDAAIEEAARYKKTSVVKDPKSKGKKKTRK